MRWSCIVLAALMMLPALDGADARRMRITVYKAPGHPIYEVAPLWAVPPAVVLFDIARRTSCDPSVAIGTGKGDPGFDPSFSPAVGNFLVPAIYRSECGGKRPKWYGW